MRVLFEIDGLTLSVPTHAINLLVKLPPLLIGPP